MKLLIKFPTRGRKNKFLLVLKKYVNLLSGENDVHFLISLDEDDGEMNNNLVREVLSEYENLTYVFGKSENKVHAINRDIEHHSEWDILLLASDDMIPQVEAYDDIIIKKMKELYPDNDGVLFFNDGFKQNKLNTLCILGKKYYDRFGYVYYPGYKSTWCDNEFTLVANLLEKQTYVDDIIIKHEHPDWGYGRHDIIHRTNFENVNFDRNLFIQRQKNNFDL